MWETVTAFLRDPHRIRELMDERRRQIEETGTLPELSKARERLEAEREREARALELYMDGGYDRQFLELKVKQIREVKEHHEREVERLEAEAADVTSTIERMSDFLVSAADIAERLDDFSEEERAETAKLLVDRVTVRGESIDVVMALEMTGDESHATDWRDLSGNRQEIGRPLY